jgi:hypothetical protein
VFESIAAGGAGFVGFVKEGLFEHGAGEGLNAIAAEDGPEEEAVSPGEFLSERGGALFAFGVEDFGGDEGGFEEEFFPERAEEFGVEMRCEEREEIEPEESIGLRTGGAVLGVEPKADGFVPAVRRRGFLFARGGLSRGGETFGEFGLRGFGKFAESGQELFGGGREAVAER